MLKKWIAHNAHKNEGDWFLLLAVISSSIMAIPFFLNVSGDAQVHLVIAEQFVRGLPFRYNLGGELVAASTSPFWTMMLILFYSITGRWAPLFLKISTVAIWSSAGYLLYFLARTQWGFTRFRLWASVALWLVQTTVVANALNGMENVLSALQLLILTYIVTRSSSRISASQSVLVGVILGWTMLTRPDGGLFGSLIIGMWFLSIFYQRRVPSKSLFYYSLVLCTSALLIWLPWHIYQYGWTQNWLSDSSIARLYNGRQGAFYVAGIHIHPKAIISLFAAFLPLLFGTSIATLDTLASVRARPAPRMLEDHLPQLIAIVELIAGICFYTFIVGAEAFGRYFLPLFPFLFLTGIDGLHLFHNWLISNQKKGLASAFIVLVFIFMLGISGLDAIRRLGQGTFRIDRVLDVIYGPADRKYHSYNLDELIAAPLERLVYTDELLGTLSAPDATDVTIAVTEVQLRYYLDDRVDILSLDGRTSASILSYYDKRSGVPDFARFLADQQPDFVHISQWCRVGGWIAELFPVSINDNLLCQWQLQTVDFPVGASFDWNDRRVTLVAPEIVRIDWE